MDGRGERAAEFGRDDYEELTTPALVPSPGTPGEGKGEGDLAHQMRGRCEHLVFEITLTPARSRAAA